MPLSCFPSVHFLSWASSLSCCLLSLSVSFRYAPLLPLPYLPPPRPIPRAQVISGTGPTRTRTKLGGDVYMAGAQSVLGAFCPTFVRCESIASQPIDKISAGFSHCAAAAASGELYCWGSNYTGCCGGSLPRGAFLLRAL